MTPRLHQGDCFGLQHPGKLESFSLAVVAGPHEEPITLDEAKRHIRVEHTAEDDDIRGWIKDAREFVERHTDLRLVTQSLLYSLAEFPHGEPIGLPVQPVQSVTSVTYYDADGDLVALSGSDYQVWADHSPPLIAAAPGSYWPATKSGRIFAVQVEFVAGYGAAADVPSIAKSLIKMIVRDRYVRETAKDQSAAAVSLGLQPAARGLLESLCVRGYS